MAAPRTEGNDIKTIEMRFSKRKKRRLSRLQQVKLEFNVGLGDDTGQWRLVEDREITPSFMEITQK